MQYIHAVRTAISYAQPGINTGLADMHIRIPHCVLSMQISKWVFPPIWRKGDPEEISRDIALRVGVRPHVVPVRPDDSTMHTRGIFLSLAEPLHYGNLHWPGNIPPLLFYCTECYQRVRHWHVVMIFHYYVRTPTALCVALRINPMLACPIKTSVENCMMYIEGQRVQGGHTEYVVNRKEALDYKNPRYFRSEVRRIQCESASLGAPYVLDRNTRRTLPWRFRGARPVTVTRDDIQYVSPTEHYVSTIPGRTGGDYKGQAVIFVQPENIRGGLRVHVPPIATFVVVT
jgi:hypothetical protein